MGVEGLTFSQLISHDFSKAAHSPTGAKYDLFLFYYQQHKQNDTNQGNVVAPLKSISFHFNLLQYMTIMKIDLNGEWFIFFSTHFCLFCGVFLVIKHILLQSASVLYSLGLNN